jgi:hypothetical protein
MLVWGARTLLGALRAAKYERDAVERQGKVVVRNSHQIVWKKPRDFGHIMIIAHCLFSHIECITGVYLCATALPFKFC